MVFFMGSSREAIRKRDYFQDMGTRLAEVPCGFFSYAVWNFLHAFDPEKTVPTEA
jgi:hypothetical protein